MNEVKTEHLKMLADYREKLMQEPKLKFLFLELTMRCNESCMHCGSHCNDVKSEELDIFTYMEFLDKIKRDFGTKDLMLCVTGGEPLLRREIYDIMGYASKLGFSWGMTSNGILINDMTAKHLYEAGMKTISISIDGLKDTHDWFRRTPKAYAKAMKGIKALVDHGGFKHVQITTVVHKRNIDELEELFKIVTDTDVDSWRVINMEPIGRAKEHPELLLDADDYRTLFNFIREKRAQGFPVEYGCTHYLGLDYEREVRDWYFLCNAGVYTASIMANGDIGACLDIERRPETIMGNILTDDFTEVWKNKFEIFRKSLAEKNEKCSACESKQFCNGGSCHSWDYDKNEQQVCFKDVLF